MGQGMDGPHLFRISVPTNHPNVPRAEFFVRALFG
jgi:hypothetical protein